MSLINIEIATNALGLEKPAHALVKGIVRGIGAALYPWQKGRETKADIDAVSAWMSQLERLPAGSSVLDLNLSSRTALRLSSDNERHQFNREAIAVASVEAFRTLEPPRTEDLPEQIDDEWLERFWRHAEAIGTEELQGLWGRILARQASGNQISARTLDFLSTLSRQEAEWIAKMASVAVGCLNGTQRGYALLSSMTHLGNNKDYSKRLGTDAARHFEPVLGSLTLVEQWPDLEAIGVLAQSGWAFEAYLPVSPRGAELTIGNRAFVICDATSTVKSNLVSGVFGLGSGIRFSQLGVELLGIVDAAPNPEFVSTASRIIRGFGLNFEPK